MVLRSGVTNRPNTAAARADVAAGYWPPIGTGVAWTLAPVLVRLAESAESLGWTVYSLGDESHREKHGDHTPWSDPGKPGGAKKRGVVYAIDVMVPDVTVPAFRKWLLAYCKSSVDTSWIDFFNLDGAQYDYAGTKKGASSDRHLHLSVRAGKENALSSLFTAWKLHVNPPPSPPAAERLVKLAGGPEIYHVRHVATMEEATGLGKRLGAVVTVDSLAEFRSVL